VKRAGNIKDKRSKGNGKVQGIESLISEAYSSHYEPIKRSGEGKDFKGWISEASSTAKNAEVGRGLWVVADAEALGRRSEMGVLSAQIVAKGGWMLQDRWWVFHGLIWGVVHDPRRVDKETGQDVGLP